MSISLAVRASSSGAGDRIFHSFETTRTKAQLRYGNLVKQLCISLIIGRVAAIFLLVTHSITENDCPVPLLKVEKE